MLSSLSAERGRRVGSMQANQRRDSVVRQEMNTKVGIFIRRIAVLVNQFHDMMTTTTSVTSLVE